MSINPNPDPRVKHLRDAQRRVRSALIANADRLSTPFTDDPDKNPWDTFVRPAMRELKAAVDAIAVSSAVSVVPPATNQTALRDRIAETLADADGWRWAEGFREQSPTWQRYQQTADAVLAALPAPDAECSAQNRNYESGPRLCIRAAQHHGDHIDENGFHWSDTVAVYPVSDGTFRRGADVRAALRRLAAEAPHAETPDAHSCGNCDGIDPDSCLTNLDRPAVKAQQAATKTPDEEPGQWCKCPSCWGWFVEEHPGEDLDELGRDLGWWSGLPEHRDAPAVVAQPGKEA